MSRPWKALVVYAAILASIGIVVAVLLYVHQQDAREDRAVLTTQSDQKLCREVEALKGNIRQVIRQSPPSIDRRAALEQFRRRDCRKLPTRTGRPSGDPPHRLPH